MAVPANRAIEVIVDLNEMTDPGLTIHLLPAQGPRGLPRLTVTGFVDISTADQFAAAIQQATAERRVLLDLTEAQFVSTAGITVLFHRRAGLAAVLVREDSIVDRALSTAGFPTIPTSRTRDGIQPT